MRKFVVSFTCLIIVCGISLAAVWGGEKPKWRKGTIEVEDMTGNEATPEAGMLKVKSEVEVLEKRGEYEVAYELINKCLAKNYSLQNMRYALEHVERHLSKLSSRNINRAKSVFVAPGMTTEEMIIENLKIQISVWLVPPLAIHDGVKKLREVDEENYQSAIKQKFILAEKEKAHDIISQYDLMRDSMKLYLKILSESYPMNATAAEKNEYLAVRKQGKALRDKLITARCNYISYQVISPALAEVSKQTYLATFKWLGFDDKQKIRDAIKLLTHSFHYDWLFSASEDVREQYCEVVKTLKDEVGSAEWEEYKVISTMLNSDDPSKPRGANAWWEK